MDPWTSTRYGCTGGAIKASVASNCSSASLPMPLAARDIGASCSAAMRMSTRGYLWPSRCVGSLGVIVDAAQVVRHLGLARWRLFRVIHRFRPLLMFLLTPSLKLMRRFLFLRCPIQGRLKTTGPCQTPWKQPLALISLSLFAL